MDLATAFNTSWPFLLVGAVALALVWGLLNGSIASLRRSIAQLGDAQGRVNLNITEIDRRIAEVGTQQTELLNRIATCERTVRQQLAEHAEQQRTAPQAPADDDGARNSLEQFDAAAETLARLARELDGLDARQSEQLLRIQGDLNEQSFHLQRVQQHVDRLFSPAAELATAESH